MALFFFTLAVLAVMVLVGIKVLAAAPYTTPHQAAIAYDPTEALSFVWSEIPAEMRDRLGSDGVGAVLGFELDYLRQSGAVLNGKRPTRRAEPHVLGSPQSVDYILERANKAGIPATSEDVHTIIGAEIAYLSSIGAVGEQAG